MSVATAAPPEEVKGRVTRRGRLRPGAAAVVELTKRSTASLEVPVTLPAGMKTLSASSVGKFERCRESFYRHYVLRERELANAKMAMGSAVSNAVSTHLIARRDGEPTTVEGLVERASAELEAELREAVATPKERRNAATAVRAGVEDYASELIPQLDAAGTEVVAAEREVRFAFPGTEWSVIGYIDLETNGPVADVKFGKNHKTKDEADFGLQGSLYVLGRYLEGSDPSDGFVFHSGRTSRPKEGARWRIVPEEAPSPRTERQLEALMARIAAVAREIARCAETGDWGYGTEGWWCSPRVCPYHASCPAGGLG